MAKDDKVRISVILPKDVHQKLVDLAVKRRRSGNGEMINLIEEAHKVEFTDA